jgi:hypothetical protein
VATAVVTNGAVTAINLSDPGSGYKWQPSITIGGPGTGAAAVALGVTLPLQPKAIHDEMNAAYDPEYGRMSGLLGLELPVTNALNQQLILYPYANPPTDMLSNSVLATPIGSLNDGTEIWKITHNGVDTHPIHFHLVDVQIVNRVAWDNALLPPEPNEIGWKETVRVNPLEHCIVAMRPHAPVLPFTPVNSVRPIDVTKSIGTTLMGFPNGQFVDPGNNAVAVINHNVNFGWEYVWHCHILSHEEMDMMHSLNLVVAPKEPSNLAGSLLNGPRRVVLNWTNNAPNVTHFIIERATNAAFTANLRTFTVTGGINNVPPTPPATTYTDATVVANTIYYYRVKAANTVGDNTVYAAPAVGWPNRTAVSVLASNMVTIGGAASAPAAPSGLAATQTAGNLLVRLSWRDNSTNETNFTVQRATAPGGPWTTLTTTVPASVPNTATGGTITYNDTRVAIPVTYIYRVFATNAAGSSAASNQATITTR